MAIIADAMDNLSKETLLISAPTPNHSETKNISDISKMLQETSEGLTHLSVQWPNYADSYDNSVLEVLKLVQVDDIIKCCEVVSYIWGRILLSCQWSLLGIIICLLLYRMYCMLIRSFAKG